MLVGVRRARGLWLHHDILILCVTKERLYERALSCAQSVALDVTSTLRIFQHAFCRLRLA